MRKGRQKRLKAIKASASSGDETGAHSKIIERKTRKNSRKTLAEA